MTLYLGKQDTKALLTAYAGKNSFQPYPTCSMRDTLLAALSTSNFALGLFAAAPVLRGAGNLFGKLVQERLWGVLTSAQRLGRRLCATVANRHRSPCAIGLGTACV